MKNKKYIVVLFALLFLCKGMALDAQTSLRQAFQTPPEEARPWCFWYWMFGAVSKAGIKADLEAMHQAGLGGTYLMPIKSPEQWPNYPNPVSQLTPEWWEMVRYSMQIADSLGLKLGMHICDGFALAGGPWITPKESMQKVVWSDTIVSGGKQNIVLPQPESYEGYYEDIALYALPYSIEESKEKPVITTSKGVTPTKDGTGFAASAKDYYSLTPEEGGFWIQYAYQEPFTCRNIEVILSGNNYQAHRLKVMASDDGVNFRFIKQLVPARQGWQNTDENSTHVIPATTARYFRFYWTPEGSEPGCEDMDAAKWKPNLKIKTLVLGSEPKISQWEGKAGLVWRVAARTTEKVIPQADCIKKKDIINLTASMKNGKLMARLPKGTWKLLRMGHTATGHTNATGGGGKGLECDKFSAVAVKKQFDNWFGKAFTETDPVLARRVLKYMHVDSWECGSQNWSDNFVSEFKVRRGYDLMPYLPLLAGVPMENVETSENVLRDVRTTIAELVVDVFYKVLAEQAKAYDCEFSAECVSPTMVSDGLLHYQAVDRPMGEFWLRSPTHDKPNDMLDAISGAHIYGKKIVQAEGFTQVRGTWDEHPGMLKALLDRNFALGINKMFYHVYTHNPYVDRKPGMTLDGIGLFFQRDQTWWKQGRAFVDYTARCQALLQYGVPVTDIAVFTGEEMPRRAILPDRLVPSLPGIFGKERVESEKIRLANVREPQREMPVGVHHSANMADPEKWINPMRGYTYDSFNRDALLRLAEVKDGKLVLPGGAAYRVLVLPLPHPMSPDKLPLSKEVQEKVETLRKAGVIIPDLPYTSDDFSAYGLERDVIVPEDIAWTHRRGEEAEIYFIANQQENERKFTVSLRISEGQPELWNPVTGEIRKAPFWKQENGRTFVDLVLASNESVFIVIGRGKSNLPDNISNGELHTNELEVKEWQVTFPLVDKTINRSSLFDWSKEEDEAIRYYSGTAIYRSEFEWRKDKKDTRIYLDLGKVANIATVRINGQECGIVWTAPLRTEVTKALKIGKNTIEIEVTNTWANAIKGADRGKAPFKGIWTNGKYRMKEDVLLEAGLIGPLQMIEEH